MNKEQIIKDAYQSGAGDTLVEDILSENALTHCNREVIKPEEMTEQEYNDLQDAVINAYRQGFYGAVSEEDIINSYIKQ